MIIPNIDIIPLDMCARRGNANTQYNCYICGKELKTPQGKALHEYGSHVKDPIECLCGKLFINKSWFMYHLARHQDVFIILYLMCKSGTELEYLLCKLDKMRRFNEDDILKIRYIIEKRKIVEDFEEAKKMVSAHIRRL